MCSNPMADSCYEGSDEGESSDSEVELELEVEPSFEEPIEAWLLQDDETLTLDKGII